MVANLDAGRVSLSLVVVLMIPLVNRGGVVSRQGEKLISELVDLITRVTQPLYLVGGE